MAMDGSAKLLSVCWTASRGVLGGLGEVLGVMLESKRAAKEKVLFQEAEGSKGIFGWILYRQ